jgi:MOSC domain-containing protein YiiM
MPTPNATLVSLNIGLPRVVAWRDAQVSTGIFKTPVDGRLRLRTLNLDGDGQADLAVHGGVDKAVYAFPSEHYPWWQAELGRAELGWGQFGENFSTTGLFETTVHIGDRFRVGSAEVVVTQPRLPCYKLSVRFGRADMPKRFLAARRTGFYLRVLQEGEVGAGDTFELVALDPNGVTVADINELYLAADPSVELLQRALEVADLPDGWRDEFESRLA